MKSLKREKKAWVGGWEKFWCWASLHTAWVIMERQNTKKNLVWQCAPKGERGVPEENLGGLEGRETTLATHRGRGGKEWKAKYWRRAHRGAPEDIRKSRFMGGGHGNHGMVGGSHDLTTFWGPRPFFLGPRCL